MIPDKVELRLDGPPGFDDHSEKAFSRQLTKAVDAREVEIRQQFGESGRPFLGGRGARQQWPFSSAKSPRSFGKLDPRVACKDTSRRIAAIDAHFPGDRDVTFAAGTYWTRVKHGVHCRRVPSRVPTVVRVEVESSRTVVRSHYCLYWSPC